MEKEYEQPPLNPEKPKSFSEKDAEKLVKAAMGEDVFERPEAKEKEPVSFSKPVLPQNDKNLADVWQKRFDEYAQLKNKAESVGDLKMARHYEASMEHANREIIDVLIKAGRIEEAKDLMKDIEDYKKEKEKMKFEQFPQPNIGPEKPEDKKEEKPTEEKIAEPEKSKGEKPGFLETGEERIERMYGEKKEEAKEEIKKEEKSAEQPKEKAKEKIEPEKVAEAIKQEEKISEEKKPVSEKLRAQVEKARKEKEGGAETKLEKGVLWLGEKLGIDSQKTKFIYGIGKGALNSVGSMFGARLGWEAPKLIYDYFTKKKLKGELSDVTIDLLQNAQLGKKVKIEKGEPDARKLVGKPLTAEQKKKREELEKRAGEKRPVLEKIKELNAKLKEAKMPSEDKKNLRTEYAQILKEYRHKGKDLKEAKTEKTGRLLNLYINNSAQKMTVARELLNTASIWAVAPQLRLFGYTALAGLERGIKAGQTYDKKHFREAKSWGKKFGKIGSVAKNLTIDSAKETFNGLTFNVFNKEAKKGKFQTSAEFASSMFMLWRAFGLVEFQQQVPKDLAMQEGAKKFWENWNKGDLGAMAEQGATNQLNNVKRILSYFHLAENPSEAMKRAMEVKTGAPKGKSAFETVQEEMKGKKQEELGRQILEKAQGEYQEKLGKEIAETAKREFIAKIATVGKGEGIEHSFIRQFENDPQGFGYKGDPNKFSELHRWAQDKAHKAAIKNGFYDSSTGEESRVIFDAKHPQQFILNKDESVEVINRNTYGWKPHEETKAVLEKAQEMTQKTSEELMAESQRIQEETSERLRILNYKTEHDLWGESDQEIQQLMNQETQKEFLREQVNIPGETPAPIVKETVAKLQEMGVSEQVIEKIPEKDLTQIDLEHFKGEVKKLEEFKAVQDELAHSGMSPEDYGKTQWGEKVTPVEMEKLIQKEISHPFVSEQVISSVHEPAPIVKETPFISEEPVVEERIAPEFHEEVAPQKAPEMSELEKMKMRGTVNIPGEEPVSKVETLEKAQEMPVGEKVEELKKIEVSKEDIEQLTEKDIQTLTPEQIEALPELEKKTQMLREAGISQEDITKLSDEDIKAMTPEQIKEFAKEAQIAEAGKTEIAREFREETIAPKAEGIKEDFGGLVSTPDGRKMFELKESGIKTIFRYNPEGKISGIEMTGQDNLLESQKLLQENWRETVMNKIKGPSNLHLSRIESQSMNLLNYKKILESMGKLGLGKSSEAEIVKKQIERIIDTTEKQYGDIFK